MSETRELPELSERPELPDPWPLSPTDHMDYFHYVKQMYVPCYPFESFCKTCETGWLRKGRLCERFGHRFEEIEVKDWQPCLVFYDGHKSCYHGSKKLSILGKKLIDQETGEVLCTSFDHSCFGPYFDRQRERRQREQSRDAGDIRQEGDVREEIAELRMEVAELRRMILKIAQ
jgi:hypothetical protein